MKQTPVNGTKEYLPPEAALRDYIEKVIAKTYVGHGFERIYTPILEDLGNLDKSDGGENLSLIFRILKRGDKFDKALLDGKDFADLGLRYDLTLPLARFYANNRLKLPNPFKCIQIDRVYRAERPQKGRLRELKQCDIDILGSSSGNAETELILVTVSALKALGLTDITVKINDRVFLNSRLLAAGVLPEQLQSVCIELDKTDKIGQEGVLDELANKGVLKNVRDVLFDTIRSGGDEAKNLNKIIADVRELSSVNIEHDPFLVRGQGYYTGSVFEIVSSKYHCSIAGGGRYDDMIGAFIDEKVPAVGFSIGFERIYDLLSESSFLVPKSKQRIVLFYEEKDFVQAFKDARTLKTRANVCLQIMPKKLGKAIARAAEAEFDGYMIVGKDSEPTIFAH